MHSHPLHQKALSFAKEFKKAQAELLEILQEIDMQKLFREWGYGSLFDYCRKGLLLSESDSYTFIRVARKSVLVPELKEAVKSGQIHLTAAKRVAPVITSENKTEWLKKAATLSQKDLERELVKENPKLLVRDTLRPLQAERVEFKCSLSEEVEKLFRRVQDIVSQKKKAPCNFEETLKEMAELYLEKNDPPRKAQRAKERALSLTKKLALRPVSEKPVNQLNLRAAPENRAPIPSSVKHEVARRDGAQCTFQDPHGNRCTQSRWTQLHHRTPLSQGGKHEPANVTTLCFHHHRLMHATSKPTILSRV